AELADLRARAAGVGGRGPIGGPLLVEPASLRRVAALAGGDVVPPVRALAVAVAGHRVGARIFPDRHALEPPVVDVGRNRVVAGARLRAGELHAPVARGI